MVCGLTVKQASKMGLYYHTPQGASTIPSFYFTRMFPGSPATEECTTSILCIKEAM